MTDCWQPTATRQALLLRQQAMQQVRAFFSEREVLEVETPLLSAYTVTDPHIEAIAAEHPSQAGRVFLQTSPEYAMKRLLAAGSGPIFQWGKAFRRGERGRRHNPEFTMLEWYRPGFTLPQLVAEVAELVCLLLGDRPWRLLTYREVFQRELGLDPHTITSDQLRDAARERLGADFEDERRDTWLQLLMSAVIEPSLGRDELTFVTDFPASQAALARLAVDEQGVRVARRFELFVDGVELANGYDELLDADELRERFAADGEHRRQSGLAVPNVDQRLLAAMDAGMPDCCGVALGVDRWLMLAAGVDCIDEVLAFPLERA